MLEVLKNLWETSGIATMTWQQGVMILISFILFYLAIKKQYEPLLLLPIAFGMLIASTFVIAAVRVVLPWST